VQVIGALADYARILAKLELRDRVQLVVVAYETGIVAAGG
jgi:DNA-binding NarL/FixJ family response regulator